MKKFLLISAVFLGLAVAHGQTTCNDLGVENGWGAWQAQTNTNNYTRTDSIIWSSPSSPSSPRFVINSGSGDVLCTPCSQPNCPNVPLVAPYGFGNASIELGEDTSANWTSEKLSSSITVTLQDTNFIYSYAVLVQDPGHAPLQQPFIELSIKDQSGNQIPCGYIRQPTPQGWGFYYAGSPCSPSTTMYKPWTTVGINLSAYIGQTLSIEIRNVDCAQGGHWAQSFWDFQCKPSSPAYCTGQQITLCAQSDAGFTYQWYQNNNPLPNSTNACVTVSPSTNDTFIVHATPPSGCAYYQIFTPTDTCITPVNEVSSIGTITVLPNPFSLQTTLHTDNLLHNATLTVYNCFGQTVAQIKNISGQTIVLHRDNLASGLYFVRLTEENKIYTDKLVITDK